MASSIVPAFSPSPHAAQAVAGGVGEQIYPLTTIPGVVGWVELSRQDFRTLVQFVSEGLACSHESEAIIAGPLSPVSSCSCSVL